MPWVVTAVGERLEAGGEGEKVQWRPALVEVPAGTFMMGSPEEESSHEVTLTHAFYMCQTEVTQGQWKAVMGDDPSDCRYGCGDDVAVHDVSWEMAIGYLNALSELEGLEPCYAKSGDEWTWDRACDGYRLPTEAEWEYAARAGTTTEYGFGDDVGLLGRYAWYSDNASGNAHVVAQKDPNAWELYDVHGNVWEWVWDRYRGDYESQWNTNPTGPVNGNSRVLRGGAFYVGANGLRSAIRIRHDPTNVVGFFGLRCARDSRPSRADGP
jgi:formylglycine-generating enzyme required for sulfatase activity